MTYAATQVAYWVGQANDNSAGQHPPGYVVSQRWSATSNTWMTMYNTEYANARDNSAGQPGKPSGNQHPTGWVAGQLWYVTATQWNTMWGTEWTNARDNSGGQTSSGLGAQHPGGYGAGQFWSTTAEQWNAMWGTEWRNARDPQGYSFSYPGQPTNAVYWSQSAQYWRGQADYYWGPNRVWNNGSTWEQLYNLYVGYYNDMVSKRDTWQSRANNAWGPNRVWSNGESWEAAYNRVLPAALWNYQAGNGGSVNVPYTGYYVMMVKAFAIGGDNCGDAHGSLDIFFGGSNVGHSEWNDWTTAGNWYGPVYCGAGTNFRSQGGSGRGFGNYYFSVVFIPTPQYAH
jgi:hypothetical protein